MAIYLMWPENLPYLRNEFMNWADVLFTCCDVIIFGQTDTVLCIFDF